VCKSKSKSKSKSKKERERETEVDNDHIKVSLMNPKNPDLITFISHTQRHTHTHTLLLSLSLFLAPSHWLFQLLILFIKLVLLFSNKTHARFSRVHLIKSSLFPILSWLAISLFFCPFINVLLLSFFFNQIIINKHQNKRKTRRDIFCGDPLPLLDNQVRFKTLWPVEMILVNNSHTFCK